MKDKKLLNIPGILLNPVLKMLGKGMLFFVLLIAVASCSGDVGLQGIPGEDGVDGSAYLPHGLKFINSKRKPMPAYTIRSINT